jgi:hypothetical protein
MAKCAKCGWLFIDDPMECLDHPEIIDKQRQAIVLELQTVAKAGPRKIDETKEQYRRRVYNEGTTDPADVTRKYME